MLHCVNLSLLSIEDKSAILYRSWSQHGFYMKYHLYLSQKITPVSTKMKFKQPTGVNNKSHSLLLQFGLKVLPTIQHAIHML